MKPMKRVFTVLGLTTALLAAPSWSASPGVQELVTSLSRHHPEYLAMLSRTEQVAGEQTEADAAFDLRVVQETYVRPSGYYDGAYAKQTVVQPIGDMNAQVFGSYRLSDGEFPIYETEYQTLDAGEASLGIKLSLLQNRDTDKRRLATTTAAWRYLEAESKQDLALNKLIYKGVSAYLSWYQSYRKLNVVRDLVRLTRDRLQAIKTRVERGALAQITLTEFESTLIKRQLLEREAEQAFELARQRLAYFWRPDGDTGYRGDRIDTPPTDIQWPYSSPSYTADHFSDAIVAHPGIKALAAKVEQSRNKQRLARNETLPQLDLEMKLARDIGEGLEPLTGTESVVGLSFFMPLGQRAAKARESIAEAEIRELEYEIRVLEDQIRRDVDLTLNALRYSQHILDLSRQQERLAEALRQQEQKRFNAGVSDQFLLISRETAELQAHLKTIDAEVDFLRQELTLRATLADLGPAS